MKKITFQLLTAFLLLAGVFNANAQCPEPTDLSATDITTSSANLVWTTGGATNFAVIYGTAGVDTISANPITVVTDTFLAVTNLSVGTTYEFYVKDLCTTDSSTWVGPTTFTTECNLATVPFAEDFQDTLIPFCWHEDYSTISAWATNNDGNSGNAFGFSSSFLSSGNVSTLTTPVFDLTSSTTLELKFMLKNTSEGTLRVLLSEDAGATFNIVLEDTISTVASYETKIIDLTAYCGVGNDSMVIGFEGTSGGDLLTQYILIDELTIDVPPTCPAPTALNMTDVTATTATFSWISGGASNYQVAYGEEYSTINDVIEIVNISDTNYTIQNLDPATTYNFFVRDSCSTTDQSEWVGEYTFTTECEVQTAPYSESFNYIPYCWTNDGWASTNDGYQGKGISYESSLLNAGASVINSPVFDFSTASNLEMRFQYKNTSNGALTVYLSQDGGLNFTDLILDTTQSASSFEEVVIDLSTFCGLGFDNIVFQFTGINGSDYPEQYVYVDEISIDVPPTCLAPTNVSLTGVTGTTASFTWTTGGSSDFNVAYGPEDFDINSAVATAVSTNSFNIGSLTASTTYDFYVQDDCGSGDLSRWVGPLTFTTNCATVSVPYFQDFESDSILTCWTETRIPASSYGWDTTANGYENRAFAFASNLFNSAGNVSALNTVAMDFSTESALELKFWYNNPTTGSLRVLISTDGSTFVALDSLGNNSGYEEIAINLNDYCGNGFDNVMLQFEGTSQGGYSFENIYIDKLSIDLPPACPESTNLTATNITTSTARLEWVSGGSSTFNVVYGIEGFNRPDNTIETTTDNFLDISGLSVGTSYEFYVQDTCSATEVSEWVGPYRFATQCDVEGAPYFEGFEGPTTPSCWSEHITPMSSTDVWESTANGYDGNAFEFTSEVNGNTSMLMTPRFDLTTETDISLSFWVNKSMSAGKLSIVLSTDGGANFTEVLQDSVVGTGAFEEKIINLSAYCGAGNNDIVIGFEAISQNYEIYGYVIESTSIVLDEVNLDFISNVNLIEAGSFSIYPNPTNGVFTLNTNFNSTNNTRVEIINLDGQTIFTKNYNTVNVMNETINISNFAKGIYYTKIINGDFVKLEKIVVY